MALEALLGELKGINGYLASAILDSTGEALAADTTASNIDLDLVGVTSNDIFRAAHEAAGKVGFSATNELVVQTPHGVIVMMCTGVNSAVHIHVVCILAKDGNQALAKMTMHKIGPKVMAELG